MSPKAHTAGSWAEADRFMPADFFIIIIIAAALKMP